MSRVSIHSAPTGPALATFGSQADADAHIIAFGLTGAGVFTADMPEDADTMPYSFVEGAYVPSIDGAKARKLVEIDAARNDFAFGGLMTPYGEVQTDGDSKANSTGAALLALISKMNGAPFTIDWTLKDNTTVTLDADGMIHLASLIAQHVNEAFVRGRAKKDEVLACTNVEDVAAVHWSVFEL